MDGGTLYLLTKHRKDQQIDALTAGTKLYRLDSTHPHQVNTLTKIDEHESIPPPTAAALSPSGDRLAVASYGAVWIFPRPPEGEHWLSTPPRTISLSDRRAKHLEAVTWDDPQTLRLSNEKRDLFLLPLGGGEGKGTFQPSTGPDDSQDRNRN